jgi:hypothetical protein
LGDVKNFGAIRRLAHFVRIKLVARRSTASENQLLMPILPAPVYAIFCQKISVKI